MFDFQISSVLDIKFSESVSQNFQNIIINNNKQTRYAPTSPQIHTISELLITEIQPVSQNINKYYSDVPDFYEDLTAWKT